MRRNERKRAVGAYTELAHGIIPVIPSFDLRIRVAPLEPLAGSGGHQFYRRAICRFGEASEISPISVLVITWPKDSKSCATITKASGHRRRCAYSIPLDAGRICVLGIPGLNITSPLIVIPLANARSCADTRSRPLLFVLSPDSRPERYLSKITRALAH